MKYLFRDNFVYGISEGKLTAGFNLIIISTCFINSNNYQIILG
jgi:hypothetical protein